MIVYRVENAVGVGPYASGDACDIWDYAYIDSDRHPGPGGRDLFEFPLTAVFGFTSKAQLRKWFHASERRAAEKLGLLVYVYKCDKRDVFRGRQQCAFSREHAACIMTINLTEI